MPASLLPHIFCLYFCKCLQQGKARRIARTCWYKVRTTFPFWFCNFSVKSYTMSFYARVVFEKKWAPPPPDLVLTFLDGVDIFRQHFDIFQHFFMVKKCRNLSKNFQTFPNISKNVKKCQDQVWLELFWAIYF